LDQDISESQAADSEFEQGMNGQPKSRYYVTAQRNAGSPKGRES